MKHQVEKEKFVFYIVGGAELVVQLRKLLKSLGVDGGQIKSKGFGTKQNKRFYFAFYGTTEN